MKQVIQACIFFCLLTGSFCSRAQSYGNEWIKDYSRTYWKIKVGKEGIYRVPLAALQGIPSGVNGSNFILYLDGKEIPVYTTTAGAFGNSDYLEFYGKKADGSLDRLLYDNPAWHPDDRISMFADTAVYFLTYDNQSSHSRYSAIANNIPSTPPPPATYCIATTGNYFLRNFNEGRNVVQFQTIPASIFDNAEGYVDTMMDVGVPLNYTLPAPHAISAPVNAVLNTAVLRSSFFYASDNIKISLNGQQVADSALPVDATQHFRLLISSSLVGGNNNIRFAASTTGTAADQYGVSYIELQYPRDFDMSNASFFAFKLNPSPAQQYIEFSNLASGSSAPKLYDLTNRTWYAGDLALAGKVRFYINPSLTDRELVLYSEGSSSITNVAQTTPKVFKNYRSTSNQGDYVIVSHSAYDATTNGHNYLTEYKNYRASATGGNYNVIIADVQELYDQFAYGHDIHPLAIRRFLKYAYDSFSVKPRYAMMIGKGLLYHKYRTYQTNPTAYPYAAIVPTYGALGSDNDFVNFLPNRLQAIRIGRLSAWNQQEVGAYLDKVKAYETALAPASIPNAETEFWKKQALHMGGGRDAGEQTLLLNTLNTAAAVITDTAYGGRVTTISKGTTNPIDIINSKTIDSLVNSGLSLVAFNGHASANGFDFSLKDPETYTSAPRLPHFIALGCDIAQIFNLNSAVRTLSERYIMAPSGGSISILASNNLQYPTFHYTYLPTVYKSISSINYGTTIGNHQKYAYDTIRKNNQSDFTYYQLESLLLQGDPALKVYGLPKPDYHVAANGIASIPANVTNTMDSFALRITTYNLARALNDTVSLKVEHINPAGIVTTIKLLKVPDLHYSDTLIFNVGINKLADVGLNKYKVTIDDDNKFDEMSEANNTGTLELFIYSDNLVPVYPKEFGIVHKPSVTLKASTLNPFRSMGRYRLEIDTTELFNSPVKQQTTISSKGGVIKWTPSITYRDSAVYYWRTSFDSIVNGDYQWSYSSFVYLANGSDGWNQSHYYQYLKNSFASLNYGNDRTFKYPVSYNQVTASNAIYSDLIPNWPWNTADFIKVMVNGIDIQRLGCYPWDGTLQINVFDSLTNAPWKNDSLNGTSGSYPVCINTRNYYTFEFPVNTPAARNKAAHFLDSIPNGNFVLVRNIINLGKYDTSFVNEWKTDPGQQLYQKMLSLGFTQIDSFNQIRPFIFFRKKGDPNYPVYQFYGQTMQDTLVKTFLLPTLKPSGNMNGVVIGPAKEWKRLRWDFSSDANPQSDKPLVTIYGINTTGAATQVYRGKAEDTSLSFISATQYPNIKMVWTSYDTINLTSPQLRYWRVLYAPVPEAALNPAAYLVFNDSLQAGQQFDFSVTVENLSDLPMDSMLVRYKLIDAGNTTHILANKRYKKLAAEDTLHASFNFDPRAYGGDNVFFVEANPDNDQPEQYHPNNLGYLPFKVIVDERNPLIDVTFDGVHILDRDIVSSKPFIKIALRDENKYLKLDDTSLLKLRIRYPSDVGTSRSVPFDGTVCRFIPAQGNKSNEATIEFKPNLPEDGIYELFVNGRDKTGNEAGASDFQISFEVVTKSSITNVLNYPNPFSTSTAFVFTLTGSQLPSQFKIQIMTVTGKVVREITKQELGPIHIGRNITEYKWDGKDQYGQTLGNGVYLYRVVTSINSEDIEHRENMDLTSYDDQKRTKDSKVDRFFKNGYGKMYIMR